MCRRWKRERYSTIDGVHGQLSHGWRVVRLRNGPTFVSVRRLASSHFKPVRDHFARQLNVDRHG